jgi:hypothetical protein
MLLFARKVQEIQYLPVYERSTSNTISRRLVEEYKKHGFSPFTIGIRDRWYLYVDEESAIS